MPSSRPRPSERHHAIAEAAVRVLAHGGLRALTHRAVDREAQVPLGTTSYHASTKQALLEIVVTSLVERSDAHVSAILSDPALSARMDSSISIEELLLGIDDVVDGAAMRSDAMRARYALLVELEPGDLRRSLLEESPMRRQLIPAIAAALGRLGLADPDLRAKELFEISDALIWQRQIVGATTDVGTVLRHYLYGATQS